jgi:hypothetical protein
VQQPSASQSDRPDSASAADVSYRPHVKRQSGRPTRHLSYREDFHQQYLAKNPGGYCGIGGTGMSCPIGLGQPATGAELRRPPTVLVGEKGPSTDAGSDSERPADRLFTLLPEQVASSGVVVVVL